MPLARTLRLACLPVGIAAVAAVSMARPSPAGACTIAGPIDHEIDPDDPDAVAPGRVSVVSVETSEFDESEGCGAGSSCDGLGTISILVRAQDDSTPLESLGFTLELASGSLPTGVSLPQGPVRGSREAGGSMELILAWSPPTTGSFDFVVEVRAVDRAGNVGQPATARVVLDEAAGSSLGRVPATGTAFLLAPLLALIGLGRRRSLPATDRRATGVFSSTDRADDVS